MAANGLDGFIVPRADEHQGEYVAARSERLKWLTGFSGSAGTAIVLDDRAVIFVDGRYTLQVRDQVDLDVFTIESLIDNPPSEWLGSNLGKGFRLGFDPWLHTIGEVKTLSSAAEKAGVTLVPLDANPIDRIWADRPAPPLAPVEIHPIAYAGELAKDKLARLAAAIAADGATHAVLTDPSSIAWAFNIRGGDVPHTPLALGFAVLAADGPHLLFMDKRKLPMVAEAYLTQLADLRAPATLDDEIAALAKAGAKIALDPALAAERLKTLVIENGGTVVPARRPGPHPARHQEPRRDRGQPRRPPPRWRRPCPSALLARQPEARHAGRDHRRHPARGSAPPDRRGNPDAAARRLLLDDRRRRLQRRDHALPRVARHQPAAWRRRALPARLRRPVSGRHHRRDPHRAHRPADGRNVRALHAGAEGHDRHFDAALSGRERAAPTSTPWRAWRCGRPGSISRMAPATASAPTLPSTRVRSALPAPACRNCSKA